MYTISLSDMMQKLQKFQQSGYLRTEIFDILDLKGQFQVELTIVMGKITSCIIKESNGKIILINDEAIHLLYNLGSLNWTLDLQPEPPPTRSHTTLPPVRPQPTIPQRTAYLNQEQTSTWPRKHRTVFALIDGRKTPEQIAAILSLSLTDIHTILRDLQAIGVIIPK